MSKRVISSPLAPAAVGPYSQAIEANGTLYVSGQLPIDAKTGEFPEGGVREQLEQILTKMDKETLYKQDEYSFESTRTKRLSLYDHKNREIAELIDSRQILVPIENRNQMFDNTCLLLQCCSLNHPLQ